MCDSCGRWYHNSCGNVKFQVADSGKWDCDRCRSERLRVLEEKLRVAQVHIEELTRRNKALEEQLRLAENGKYVEKRDTVTEKSRRVKCLVLGDSIIRNVGADKSHMKVECFPGIRSDQLRRVIENRELLFLAYVNDIWRNIESKIRLFADDCIVYRKNCK